MSDRVPACITIGGTLCPEDYASLCVLITSEGLKTEWDVPFVPEFRKIGESLTVFGEAVLDGRFVDLEAFCIRKGLWFARWCGHVPIHPGPRRAVFTGSGEVLFFESNEDHEVVVSYMDAKRLGSWPVLMAHYENGDRIIPPLDVEGDVHAPEGPP